MRYGVPVHQLNELKFVCRRFRATVTLSNRLDYDRRISHEIFDTDEMYRLFTDLYDNVLFERFKYYFDFETRCYLSYQCSLLRIIFYVLMCWCTWSDYTVVNHSKCCSLLHVSETRSNFFKSLTLLYTNISVNTTFNSDVASLC